jgi:uroporphyrinogen decarboxylase
MAAFGPQEVGDWTDADGFVHHREDRWIGGGIRSRPFDDEAGATEWLKKAIQRLAQPLDREAHARAFVEAHDRTQGWLGDDTVVIYEFGPGLDWIRYMLGFQLFAYVSVDDPGLVSEYLELYTLREIERIRATADPQRSPCALPYGDIAAKRSLLHSPAWLRQEFFPRLKRIVDELHNHGVKALFHSDGYLMEIMPDLIDCGIDGLNPIETVAGMDLKEVKSLYGDRIFLTGGIDISQLMANGTTDEVREVCTQAVRDAAPGYFIGSTTELDNGSRLENVLTMLDVVWNG